MLKKMAGGKEWGKLISLKTKTLDNLKLKNSIRQVKIKI